MPVFICMTIHMERTCNCRTRKVTKEVGLFLLGLACHHQFGNIVIILFCLLFMKKFQTTPLEKSVHCAFISCKLPYMN